MINGCIDEWMGGWMDRWINGRIGGRMNGSIDDGWMNGRLLDGLVDEWIIIRGSLNGPLGAQRHLELAIWSKRDSTSILVLHSKVVSAYVHSALKEH